MVVQLDDWRYWYFKFKMKFFMLLLYLLMFDISYSLYNDDINVIVEMYVINMI